MLQQGGAAAGAHHLHPAEVPLAEVEDLARVLRKLHSGREQHHERRKVELFTVARVQLRSHARRHPRVAGRVVVAPGFLAVGRGLVGEELLLLAHPPLHRRCEPAKPQVRQRTLRGGARSIGLARRLAAAASGGGAGGIGAALLAGVRTVGASAGSAAVAVSVAAALLARPAGLRLSRSGGGGSGGSGGGGGGGGRRGLMYCRMNSSDLLTESTPQGDSYMYRRQLGREGIATLVFLLVLVLRQL